MSLLITQTPTRVNLSQSPIVFTVVESGSVDTLSSYQYVGELYYWTGSLTNSGSQPDYTINKFPNQSGRGIFELSRLLTSTLTDSAEENKSNVKYFALDFYYQYLSGSTFVSSSKVRSSTYTILDGYATFQEPIGQAIEDKTPNWPFMTDVTEVDVLEENRGTLPYFIGIDGTTKPEVFIYSSSLGTNTFDLIPGSGAPSLNSTTSVNQLPIYPSSPSVNSIITQPNVEWYTIQLGRDEGTVVPVSPPIKFNIKCPSKYPNVRIKWKNRYGQFDYLNFNLTSRQSFQTTQRTYQPQLGSWEGTSLSYNRSDSSIQNYISDSEQTITVNTNWLTEDYNEILKQLLVSDEIYWIYDEANNLVRPLAIQTTNLQFKSGVVDKLIQYQFDFKYGQSYKLII